MSPEQARARRLDERTDVRRFSLSERGEPERLFPMSSVSDFDAAPDGERFIVIQDNVDALPKDIHVVLNWAEELRGLVPTTDK